MNLYVNSHLFLVTIFLSTSYVFLFFTIHIKPIISRTSSVDAVVFECYDSIQEMNTNYSDCTGKSLSFNLRSVVRLRCIFVFTRQFTFSVSKNAPNFRCRTKKTADFPPDNYSFEKFVENSQMYTLYFL